MNTRIYSKLFVALLLVGVGGQQAFAQQLELRVDRHTGQMQLTGVDAGVVDFAGYEIRSARDTLVDANWNGLRDTEPDWVLAGTPGSDVLQELNSNGASGVGAVVNDTLQLDLGTGIYDPSTALAGLNFGDNVEASDLSISYYDQIADVSRTGVVNFVGERIYNDIGLTIDLATGIGYIENESPTSSLTITGYLIESRLDAGTGKLNTAGSFTGLGGSFGSPAAPDGDNLGEIDSSGSGFALASSTGVGVLGTSLGVVVDPALINASFGTGGDEDNENGANGELAFSFILDGVGETSQAGFVKYINVPTNPIGDYNNNGTVDAADYTVWRDNLGQAFELPNRDPANTGNVSTDDYASWKNNFGQGGASGGGSGAAVPEPSAVLLLLAGICGAAANRRR